jgi:small neutral amino acid transporter SnatA (MarC family)
LLVNQNAETALTAFTTFFAVIGPIDSAVLVASLTPNATRRSAARSR